MKKINNQFYFNKLQLLGLIFLSMTFQFCNATKKTSNSKKNKVVVSYEKNIKPIMLTSCTPCHFPDRGRVKMLDTYAATKENIDEILSRFSFLIVT